LGEPEPQPKANGAPIGSIQNPRRYLRIKRLALFANGGTAPLRTALDDEALRDMSEPIEMISKMDLTIQIKYKALSLIPLSRDVRFTASRSSGGPLVWRPTPTSEPEIMHGTGEYISLKGVTIEARGNLGR